MTRTRATAAWSTLAALVLISLPGLVHAACEASVGKFVSITGSVDVQSSGGNAWSGAKLETRLCEGDTIRVGERSRAAVSLINNAVLRIDQNTAMRLIDISPEDEEQSLLDLFTGAFQSFSRKPKFLRVNTPYLNGSVEGTEFVFRVSDDEATITVLEGVVLASNNQGELRVTPGESAQASKGQAPQKRVIVKPRDLVQWGLYYPPVMSAATPGDVSPAIQNAATLLSLGRVDEARAEIDAALQKDTKSGAAYALRAVIAVALNDNETALSDARRAVELSPGSASAKIALSYAQQANLELAAARDTLLQAVEQEPENALALARLAELHLMLGSRREATAAAERAVALEPGLSRTQNVLGFAALAQIRPAQAQAAFEQAIALDSDDPMPRLGLGLAKIRQGQLEEGRADLEAAVALDSNNALLRAYLGKAYFEEERGPLDATQFEVAKELDPLDPTAYFYNAISLQTENQPVEALRELEAAIERNDNRAIYRGRLLLDKDRASRGTSQARVYNDLGFRQLGINSASDSVTLDPSNAAAHRFLSDTYRTAPRHETSRVSELQQAQMLQDVNINPIQPSLSDTNLNIVTQGGPAAAGFNEFTPLFERNRAQVNVSGFYGSNDTVGGEAVVSGVYDNLSLSAGRFTYDTDGYRGNNDLKHEIYNVFGQVAVTPAINLQAEYQKRNSDYGDLAMNFDPDSYSQNQRNTLDTESTRLGATLRPSASSTLLALYNHYDADFSKTDQTELGSLPSPPFPPGLPPILLNEDLSTDEKSDQFEGAYIFQADAFNILAGAAYTDVDREDTIYAEIEDPLVPFPIPVTDEIIDADSEDKRGYVYANIMLPSDVTVTLGVSYQDYEEDLYDLNETNPKFGVVWDVNDTLRLRGTYFEVMKPVLSSNRTLEPTQVAGFNQFFDDLDATRSKRYGVGADWRPREAVSLGAELTRRKLKSPAFDFAGDVTFDDRDEWTHRAYANWTPSSNWALSLEGVYDRFENDDDSPLAAIVPERVRTVSVPAKATYFHPNGFFGSVGVTYVDQEVDRASASDLAQGDSDFTLVDLSVGYRLPKRRGIVSLSVQNLFDKDFMYQDDSYREFGDEPSMSPYTPERVIMGRLVLNF